MHHSSIDQYARGSSFFHFDSRTKIISTIFFIVIVALLRDIITLVIAMAFIFTIIAISGIPKKHFFKRYLIALPFIIFSALAMLLTNDLESFITMIIRISTCVLALILLLSSTSFFELLKGFQYLKMPTIFIVLLMFTYRYFFVFIDEQHRMRLARKARGFKGGKHLFDMSAMRTIGYTAGMLLVRAYNRGVRIYDALEVRDFNGKIKTMSRFKFSALDLTFGCVFIFISLFVLYYDWLVII